MRPAEPDRSGRWTCREQTPLFPTAQDRVRSLIEPRDPGCCHCFHREPCDVFRLNSCARCRSGGDGRSIVIAGGRRHRSPAGGGPSRRDPRPADRKIRSDPRAASDGISSAPGGGMTGAAMEDLLPHNVAPPNNRTAKQSHRHQATRRGGDSSPGEANTDKGITRDGGPPNRCRPSDSRGLLLPGDRR